MSEPDVQELRDVIAEIANALQGAVGLAALVRRGAPNVPDDAAKLEAAIHRAIITLRRVQPRPRRAGR